MRPEVQILYQCGVGSLLYLLRHSQPELSNPIRAFSKAMGGANDSALNEMYKVIKWVLNTENLGLNMEPNIETDNLGNVIWKLEGNWKELVILHGDQIQMMEEVLLVIFFISWGYLYHGNQKHNLMSLFYHLRQNMLE